MGVVHFSLDVQLIEALQEVLPLPVLVETGTFEGETVIGARSYFRRLYSIELVEAHHQVAAERIGADDAVDLRCGESAAMLTELRGELGDESVLYWLDAHWCAGGEIAPLPRNQCPLLDELAAIGSLNQSSVILIDDARYFLAPPPPPNDASQWPTLDEVLNGLRALSEHHELLVVNDVIVFHPRSVRARLGEFARERGVDWFAAMEAVRSGADPSTVSELRTRLAHLEEVAAERLRLLEEVQGEYERVVELSKELEAAATERLDLLRAAVDERMQAERRCEQLERAAAERLELLERTLGERAEADERCAGIERAAEQRRVLLEQISERRDALEGLVARFEAALTLRDQRLSEVERALDQRSLELEQLRGEPAAKRPPTG